MHSRRTLPMWAVVFLLAGLLAPSVPAAPPVALAQNGCLAESEPNDAPESATTFDGPACFTGALPPGDQDIWLWTVPVEAATQRWTFSVTGVFGTVTGLKVLPVDSEPGIEPIVPGYQLFEVANQPGDAAPVTVANVLLAPGQYLLGLARSGTLDGGEPLQTGYAWSVEAGDPLPPVGDVEPNDDDATAVPVSGAFALSGDRAGSADAYAWTLSGEEAEGGWRLRAAAPAGSSLTIDARDAAGSSRASYMADAFGVIDVPDLKLPAGTIFLVVSSSGDEPGVYLLETVPGPAPGGDAEPNDAPAAASPLDPAAPVVKGRLGHAGDTDYYRHELGEEGSSSLLDIKLIWRSGISRTLCIELPDQTQLQCRSGQDGIALANLRLPAGPYIFRVSGDPAPDDPYILRIDAVAAPDARFETEPNDRVELATPFDLAAGISGRLDGSEDDFLRTTITGEPRLYDLTVTGSGIERLSLVDAAGNELMGGDIALDRTSGRVSDLFLIPGEHLFRVSGTAGDYTLTLTPLGPPDPLAEREPNNSSVWGEPLIAGGERTGRLVETSDTDVYRFSLAATERVVVTLTPPADGAVTMRLLLAGTGFGHVQAPEIGAPLVYDALLPPGDYELWLRAATPSEGRYALKIDRADPFLLAGDQEPNDGPAWAKPLPATPRVEGEVGQFGDDDWFRLPGLDEAAGIAIVISGGVSTVAISDGTTETALAADADGVTYRSDRLPAGVPHYLRVSGSGPYTLEVSYPGGAVEPATERELDVELAFTAATDRVAAYWPAGQRIDATLTLTSDARLPREVTLDAVTSHFRWSVELDRDRVVLPPGIPVSVPVTIRVLPQAWADIPVRATVRAMAANGAAATAFVELVPDREGEPVNPEQAWELPPALLGGLDVASLGLGAVVLPSFDETAERALHDGVTPAGGGFSTSGVVLPLTLTVDLAGDEPVPVAGFVLNPQAGDGSLELLPREFDLLLSEDGVDYTVVLSGVLEPLLLDQAFPLPEPAPARYAQLVIRSTYSQPAYGLVLGEWKVIAEPGFRLGDEGLNIADPALGGHVVRMSPQGYDPLFAEGLLSADPARVTLRSESGAVEWVVGFQHNRAASIVELQWVDPDGSDPATRFDEVTVEVSLAGPTGPWEPLGDWRLERLGDGAVAPFTLDGPAWARFLRFSARVASNEATEIEYPATLRVIERPIDDGYWSVAAEWGQDSPAGPYELAHPAVLVLPPDNDPGDDTPDAARPLAAGDVASGRVHIDRDVDWYEVRVPEGQDTLRFEVGGDPTVRVTLSLVDANGREREMTFAPSAGAVTYTARVEPGATYRVRVEQPPHSVAFIFDTSISLANYQPYIYQGIRAFGGAVTPGQDFVQIIPFEAEPLLPDWSDQPYALQAAIAGYVDELLSSSAETAMIDAATLLAEREGARAILVITDAETTSYDRGPELWELLDRVRPAVFSVHIGANTTPILSRHIMQDWASVAGGVYRYTRSHGEMDRAFDQLATWLRRPAAYTLTFAASSEAEEAATPEPEPTPAPEPTPTPEPAPAETPAARRGSLAIRSGEPEPGQTGVVAGASAGTAVEIILDTSGSMLAALEDGSPRIDVAKAVLTELVTETLPAGAPVALRVFGEQPDSCETRLAVPLQPLDPAAMSAQIQGLVVVNLVRTPIGAALEQVAQDLAGHEGPKIVLLVTDGEETCDGDPAAAIQALIDQGFDVRVNIVGFALDDEALKATFREWARIGNGSYFDATDAEELSEAVALAASAPFEVYDAAGTVVATGTVDGAPVRLRPGTYTVVVLTDPEVRIEGVVVESGERTRLELSES